MPAKPAVLLKYNQKHVATPMAIPRRIKGYTNIQEFFMNNVVEFRFKRRTKLPHPRTIGHKRVTRRMLATTNWRFISSPLTKRLFKWKKPKSRRGRAFYKRRDLIIVWDILSEDFRMVSLDDLIIIAATPVTTLINKARFYLFYRHKIAKNKMTKKQRNDFADKL